MEQAKIFEHISLLKKRVEEYRKKDKVPRTYIEETLTPYLPYFRWENDTFFKDMAGFQIAVREFLKSNTDDKLKELLEWAKPKNLHPLQFAKAVYAVLRKQSPVHK